MVKTKPPGLLSVIDLTEVNVDCVLLSHQVLLAGINYSICSYLTHWTVTLTHYFHSAHSFQIYRDAEKV